MPKKRSKIIKKRVRSKRNSNVLPKVTALSALVIFFLLLLFLDSFKFSLTPGANKQPLRKYSNSRANIYPPLIIEHGPRNKKEIALTFDADMTYAMIDLLDKGVVKTWYNKPIIDYLNKKGIKATIFFTGLWVKTYPHEAKEIAKNSLFEIGNHSYSHPAFTADCYKLPFIPNNNDVNEIEIAQKEIVNITGTTPQFFRFPGGCSDNYDLKTVSELGLRTVHWDVVSGDALNQNTQMIISNVERRVQNGSIIVMHLNGGLYAPKTYFALTQIIPELEKRGFTFVKISELLRSN